MATTDDQNKSEFQKAVEAGFNTIYTDNNKYPKSKKDGSDAPTGEQAKPKSNPLNEGEAASTTGVQ